MYSSWICYAGHNQWSKIKKTTAQFSRPYFVEDDFASMPKQQNDYSHVLNWNSAGGSTQGLLYLQL